MPSAYIQTGSTYPLGCGIFGTAVFGWQGKALQKTRGRAFLAVTLQECMLLCP